MFDDFDRDYNRTKKVVVGAFIFQGILVVLVVVGIIYGIGYVMNHGLKGTVDRIWNGPTNSVSTNQVN